MNTPLRKLFTPLGFSKVRGLVYRKVDKEYGSTHAWQVEFKDIGRLITYSLKYSTLENFESSHKGSCYLYVELAGNPGYELISETVVDAESIKKALEKVRDLYYSEHWVVYDDKDHFKTFYTFEDAEKFRDSRKTAWSIKSIKFDRPCMQ